METNYNIVEYANSLFQRHDFETTDEKVNLVSGQEKYKSHYTYTDEIISYCKTHFNDKGNNTIEGYDGPVALTEFVIDIDIDEKTEELQLSFDRTRELLKALETNYQLDLETLRINFSGCKGFHIRFDSRLFDGFEPSISLPNAAKEIAIKLADGIIKIDKSIYDKTRLMRVVNSCNKKSGRYAIPLTAAEIFSMTIDEIVTLAEQPREFHYDDSIEIIPNPKLVELKEETLLEDENNQAPINKLLDPKGAGERHETLAVLVGKLIAAQWKDEDIIDLMKVWDNQNTPPMGKGRILKETKDLLKRYADIKGDFWRIKRGKHGLRASLSLDDFIKYLNGEGFGKVLFGKSYDFVKQSENIASMLTSIKITDYVFEQIDKKTSNKQFNKLIREFLLEKVNKYFSEKLLERINTVEMNIKKDTVDTSYLFFTNGIVTVKRDADLEVQKYDSLDSPVWDTQIKERSFDQIDIKYQQSVFEKFLWNTQRNNTDRMLAICSAIGYLLHKYKNRSTAKAVVMMDEKVSETPVGRTGKSLVGKAISCMRDSVRIDGKNFKFRDQFTFQEISPKTEIAEFNDVKDDFDFERLFSVLTDDMSVEYKQQPPFPLPFERSPKIMISTNYSIRGIGDSFSDRMFEVEFSDYYNAKRKPIDEFGHLFFDDWNEVEWNRFDNFMVECLQLYLDNGLVSYKKINIDNKKLLLETSSEFLEFMRGSFVVQVEYSKNDLYEKFKKELGYENDLFGKCPIKINTFTKYLKAYANYQQLNYKERESNGKRYVELCPVQS